MNGLLRDLQYAFRTLVKSPGFTTVSLLTLAIGIGGNTAIFSFVDSPLLRPLPYPEADRIVRVLEKPPGFPRNGISTLNFLDWQRQNTVFDYMAGDSGGGAVTLTGSGEPVQLRSARVSAHYFDIFGVQAAVGRTFSADEDQVDKELVAVLSHALWVSQFGADSNLIGRTIRLDGEAYTVIGVLPEDSAFNRANAQIWIPLVFRAQNMTRDFHWFGSFARLKRGNATLHELSSSLRRRILRTTWGANSSPVVSTQPIHATPLVALRTHRTEIRVTDFVVQSDGSDAHSHYIDQLFLDGSSGSRGGAGPRDSLG